MQLESWLVLVTVGNQISLLTTFAVLQFQKSKEVALWLERDQTDLPPQLLTM